MNDTQKKTSIDDSKTLIILNSDFSSPAPIIKATQKISSD